MEFEQAWCFPKRTIGASPGHRKLHKIASSSGLFIRGIEVWLVPRVSRQNEDQAENLKVATLRNKTKSQK